LRCEIPGEGGRRELADLVIIREFRRPTRSLITDICRSSDQKVPMVRVHAEFAIVSAFA
jgi:hypothetical protein